MSADLPTFWSTVTLKWFGLWHSATKKFAFCMDFKENLCRTLLLKDFYF